MHKVFDEKLSLDIINLNFQEEKIQKEKKNGKINLSKKPLQKKIKLDEIIRNYTIKKNPNELSGNLLNRRDSQTSSENLKYDMEPFRGSNTKDTNLSYMNDVIIDDNNSFDIPMNSIIRNNLIDLEKAVDEIDLLEGILMHVPIPYFVEYANDLKIDPKINKCYIVKNNIELILKE